MVKGFKAIKVIKGFSDLNDLNLRNGVIAFRYLAPSGAR